MTMNQLDRQITEAVEAFTSNDLAYSDNALVVIDPVAATATLLDPDEDADTDAMIDADPAHDYVAVMDLVEADPQEPGRWIPCAEAIADLCADDQG